jgi:hypothetical protein
VETKGDPPLQEISNQRIPAPLNITGEITATSWTKRRRKIILA